jgi:methylmalonyl-CoA mutase C-terminal domain/subunit
LKKSTPDESVNSKASSIRVLLAKPGLDGHDRGVKVILRALLDAGMEVIYTGMRVTPEAIVLAAVQEDVDAIGLSNHSGAYRTLFESTAQKLIAAGVDLKSKVLFCGGAIPPTEVPKLEVMGFRGVFTPGTSLETIVQFLRKEVHGNGEE